MLCGLYYALSLGLSESVLKAFGLCRRGNAWTPQACTLHLYCLHRAEVCRLEPGQSKASHTPLEGYLSALVCRFDECHWWAACGACSMAFPCRMCSISLIVPGFVPEDQQLQELWCIVVHGCHLEAVCLKRRVTCNVFNVGLLCLGE